MLIRTATDIGALIRQRRHDLKLDQRTLAERVGVGRKWIVEVEAGKPTKELQLVLRTLDVLGIRLQTVEPKKNAPAVIPLVPDIDAIVRAAREPTPWLSSENTSPARGNKPRRRQRK